LLLLFVCLILFIYLFAVAEDLYFVDYVIDVWKTQRYKLEKPVFHYESYGNSIKEQ